MPRELQESCYAIKSLTEGRRKVNASPKRGLQMESDLPDTAVRCRRQRLEFCLTVCQDKETVSTRQEQGQKGILWWIGGCEHRSKGVGLLCSSRVSDPV